MRRALALLTAGLALFAAASPAWAVAVPPPQGKAAAQHGSSARPVIGTKAGFFALATLTGPGPQVLRPSRPRLVYHYQLPAGAAPGRPLWLTLRLHAKVQFAPGANGLWLFSASAAGYAAAQVELGVRDGRVTLSSLGLVSGRQQTTSGDNQTVIAFENYLQDKADRPGPEDLTLKVDAEVDHSAGLDSIVMLPDSGLSATSITFEELGLQTSRRPLQVQTGDTVVVPYRLLHRAGRPDGPTTVALNVRDDALKVRGPDHVDYQDVGRGRAGAFRMHAGKPGTYQVQLQVPYRYNQPARILTIVITPRARRHLNQPLAAGAGAAVLLVGGGAVARRRQHRRSGVTKA